jgi:hypothetical protein
MIAYPSDGKRAPEVLPRGVDSGSAFPPIAFTTGGSTISIGTSNSKGEASRAFCDAPHKSVKHPKSASWPTPGERLAEARESIVRLAQGRRGAFTRAPFHLGGKTMIADRIHFPTLERLAVAAEIWPDFDAAISIEDATMRSATTVPFAFPPTTPWRWPDGCQPHLRLVFDGQEIDGVSNARQDSVDALCQVY